MAVTEQTMNRIRLHCSIYAECVIMAINAGLITEVEVNSAINSYLATGDLNQTFLEEIIAQAAAAFPQLIIGGGGVVGPQFPNPISPALIRAEAAALRAETTLDTISSAIANYEIARTTLTALNSVTTNPVTGTPIGEGQIGVVYGTGADRGVYRRISNAWVYQHRLFGDIDVQALKIPYLDLTSQRNREMATPKIRVPLTAKGRQYAMPFGAKVGNSKFVLGGLLNDGRFHLDKLLVTNDLIIPKKASITMGVPRVGNWKSVVVKGKVIEAVDLDGYTWQHDGTKLVRQEKVADIAARTPITLPRVKNYKNIFLSPTTKRIVSFETLDGQVFNWDGQNYKLDLFNSKAVDPSGSNYVFDFNTQLAWAVENLNDDPDVVYMIMIDGQSFAYVGGDDGIPFSTTVLHPGKALMPNPGPRPDGAEITSLVDLKEVAPYETPCTGMADFIMNGVQAAFGKKPTIVFAVAALGGTSYSGWQGINHGLKKGTRQYNESLRIVSRVNDIVRGQGKRLVVIGHYRLHGENDNSNPAVTKDIFKRYLEQSRIDFEDDVKKITGQSESIRRIIQQHIYANTTYGEIRAVAQAQIDIGNTDPMQVCCGPSPYIDVGVVDAGHPLPRSKADMGRQAGYYFLQDFAGAGIGPMKVVDSWWISPTKIALQYTYPIAIETDDSKIVISTLGPSQGFDFFDNSTPIGTPPMVTVKGISVSASNSRVLEVELTGVPTGPRPHLLIAARRAPNFITGRVHGPRCPVRRQDAIVTANSFYPSDVYAWAATQVVYL